MFYHELQIIVKSTNSEIPKDQQVFIDHPAEITKKLTGKGLDPSELTADDMLLLDITTINIGIANSLRELSNLGVANTSQRIEKIKALTNHLMEITEFPPQGVIHWVHLAVSGNDIQLTRMGDGRVFDAKDMVQQISYIELDIQHLVLGFVYLLRKGVEQNLLNKQETLDNFYKFIFYFGSKVEVHSQMLHLPKAEDTILAKASKGKLSSKSPIIIS